MKQLLVFVLFSAFLCWLMFAPIYKHVIVMRQAALQKEVDYLLEIGANGAHGFIDAAMVSESKERLAASGFIVDDLQFSVLTTTGESGTDASRPVMRGIGIHLQITYPYRQLFVIDRLIGISPPDAEERMGAGGLKMSEYVP